MMTYFVMSLESRKSASSAGGGERGPFPTRLVMNLRSLSLSRCAFAWRLEHVSR